MAFRRFYANSAPQQQLAAPISSESTSLTISGTFIGWPTSFPFFACLDKSTGSMEIVLVTGIIGTTAQVSRAQDGTPAISHTAGATLDQVVVRQDFDEASQHISAQTNVHGVGSQVVGIADTQTLTNKTLASPTITTPTITTPAVTGGTFADPVLTGTATGTAWDKMPRGYIDENAATSATLKINPASQNFTEFPASVNFTLTSRRRIRIAVRAIVDPSTATVGHYFMKAGYKLNGGATQTPGTSTPFANANASNIGALFERSYLLDPGTYSFFPVCSSTVGNANDLFSYGYIVAYDEGNA